MGIPTNTYTVTPTSTLTATQTPSCGVMGSAFVHPGAWSSCAELNFVKAQILAGNQPWTQQLANLEGQTGGSASGLNVNGKLFDSCNDESDGQTDSALCYANALAWYLTGTQSYYTKAMGILANYATMTGMTSSCGWNQQYTLDAGWFGGLFANACELLRMNPSWTTADTTTYVNMFKTGWYPGVTTMSNGNGNVDLTQIDAMMSMAVFCDDQTTFGNAVTRYQARIPAYIYSSTWPQIPNSTNPDTGNNMPATINGDLYNGPATSCSPQFPNNFWMCPNEWIAGLMQETCRDNGHHAQFGLDAAVQCAEIDYHQGSTYALYATYETFLVPALELLAQELYNDNASPCNGLENTQDGGQAFDTFEIGYNEYVNRLGLGTAQGTGLYYTNLYLPELRNNATYYGNTLWALFNISWETLTHAGVN